MADALQMDDKSDLSTVTHVSLITPINNINIVASTDHNRVSAFVSWLQVIRRHPYPPYYTYASQLLHARPKKCLRLILQVLLFEVA